jgi:hypothetical protein
MTGGQATIGRLMRAPGDLLRPLPVVLTVALGLLPLGTAATARNENDRLREAAVRIVDRRHCQRELPRAASDSDDERHALSFHSSDHDLSVNAPAVESSATFVVVVAALALVAVALAIVLTRRRSGSRSVVAVPAAKPVAVVASSPPPASTTSAAELAASGDFAEAIHRLVAEAIARLAALLRLELAQGTTNREFVPRVREEPARHALHDLVLRAERHRFAGLPAAEADWLESVELARQVAGSPPPAAREPRR